MLIGRVVLDAEHEASSREPLDRPVRMNQDRWIVPGVAERECLAYRVDHAIEERCERAERRIAAAVKHSAVRHEPALRAVRHWSGALPAGEGMTAARA